jgi:hypothetical protein
VGTAAKRARGRGARRRGSPSIVVINPTSGAELLDKERQP